MNPKTFAAMTALLAALQGCASTAELEARQLAWRGPSSGPCLFGGVTSRSVQHCARVDFGDEALMQAVNTQVLRDLGRRPRCTAHAAAAQQALRNHPEVRTQLVYSCPSGDERCHVSLLARGADGRSYVLDNGSVLAREPGHVGSFEAYAQAVGQRYWLGRPPTLAEARGIDELFAGLTLSVASRAP